jgi:hypothetical protein
MKITSHNIQDKLNVFALTGHNTAAYDYAIPQPLFDRLQEMGIENPGRWFVGDCTGISVKLRHCGEALYELLQHRSQAYTEQIQYLFEVQQSPEVSIGDKMMYEFIMDFPDNAICNEADAGFLDLRIIVAAWTDGFSRGRKALRAELAENSKALVNEKPKHIMESQEKPAEGGMAPLKVVLRENPVGKGWVTHILNLQTEGYSHGHYFDTQHNAMVDYMNRCEGQEVAPF